jgi:hypothetical protein
LIIERRFVSQAREGDVQIYGDRRFTGTAGTLVAESDSWFDYPNSDVLKMQRR